MQTQDGIVTPENATIIGRVDTNRAIEWVSGGFNLFLKKPGEFVIAGLILFVITFVLNYIPILGGGLTTMLGVIAAGAMMMFCRAVENGQDPLVESQKVANITPLWILSAIAAGAGIGIALIGVVLGAALVGLAFVSPTLAVAMAGLIFGAMTLISIPVIMALWLAPGLVVFKGAEPIDAIRLSFGAATKNIGAFIVFYILAVIAAFIGGLLLRVGLIVVYPIVLCAVYMAYKDIFGAASPAAAVSLMKEAS
jgi:hypothetical protein